MLIYFDKSLISLNEQINQSDVLNKLSPEYSLNLLISSIPNINDCLINYKFNERLIKVII